MSTGHIRDKVTLSHLPYEPPIDDDATLNLVISRKLQMFNCLSQAMKLLYYFKSYHLHAYFEFGVLQTVS